MMQSEDEDIKMNRFYLIMKFNSKKKNNNANSKLKYSLSE